MANFEGKYLTNKFRVHAEQKRTVVDLLEKCGFDVEEFNDGSIQFYGYDEDLSATEDTNISDLEEKYIDYGEENDFQDLVETFGVDLDTTRVADVLQKALVDEDHIEITCVGWEKFCYLHALSTIITKDHIECVNLDNAIQYTLEQMQRN